MCKKKKERQEKCLKTGLIISVASKSRGESKSISEYTPHICQAVWEMPTVSKDDLTYWKKTKLYILFSDYSKAYDRVPRGKLVQVLRAIYLSIYLFTTKIASL